MTHLGAQWSAFYIITLHHPLIFSSLRKQFFCYLAAGNLVAIANLHTAKCLPSFFGSDASTTENSILQSVANLFITT
jgi:hypothetical protein